MRKNVHVVGLGAQRLALAGSGADPGDSVIEPGGHSLKWGAYIDPAG